MMRRILKWVGIILVVFIVIIGGFLSYVAINGIPRYEAKKIDLVVDKSPERVSHGRELATKLCMLCHRDPETGRLSGVRLADLPEAFGVAYSKNITQHKERGIGTWTDGEIAWLLRTGIHPRTGMYVPPWMPKFPHMSDYDLHSIIAFLRSDDDMLKPDERVNREAEPTFFAKFLCYVAFKPFEYPSSSIPHPDTSNTVAYGKYLATGVHDCYQCHSKDFSTMDPVVPENSEGFFGGGLEMPDASGLIVKTSNITGDKLHGVGRYSRDEFISLMSTNIRPDGTPLRYPMVSYRSLGPHALGSLYDYLITTPALPNTVSVVKPTGPWSSKGAQLFDTYACTSCHGKTGIGVVSLMKADTKYYNDSVLADVIKTQWKYNPDSFMPTFDGRVSNEDLAILAIHVRELSRK
jgi:mono/diheme cytochrome c family protein